MVEKKKKAFNPDRPPFRTMGGMDVKCVKLKDKIMGVIHDEVNGSFCTWDLKGQRVNIFPRKKTDSPMQDLVNKPRRVPKEISHE